MRSVVVGIAWMSVVACTHYRPYAQVQDLVGKDIRIETHDERTVDGVAVQGAADIEFRPLFGELTPKDIAHVIEVRRGRGAIEGLAIGALIGVVAGVSIGLIENASCRPDDCIPFVTASDYVLIGGLGLGGIGAGVGLLVGFFHGSYFVYSTSERSIVPIGPPGSTAGATVTF